MAIENGQEHLSILSQRELLHHPMVVMLSLVIFHLVEILDTEELFLKQIKMEMKNGVLFR